MVLKATDIDIVIPHFYDKEQILVNLHYEERNQCCKATAFII